MVLPRRTSRRRGGSQRRGRVRPGGTATSLIEALTGDAANTTRVLADNGFGPGARPPQGTILNLPDFDEPAGPAPVNPPPPPPSLPPLGRFLEQTGVPPGTISPLAPPADPRAANNLFQNLAGFQPSTLGSFLGGTGVPADTIHPLQQPNAPLPPSPKATAEFTTQAGPARRVPGGDNRLVNVNKWKISGVSRPAGPALFEKIIEATGQDITNYYNSILSGNPDRSLLPDIIDNDTIAALAAEFGFENPEQLLIDLGYAPIGDEKGGFRKLDVGGSTPPPGSSSGGFRRRGGGGGSTGGGLSIGGGGQQRGSLEVLNLSNAFG